MMLFQQKKLLICFMALILLATVTDAKKKRHVVHVAKSNETAVLALNQTNFEEFNKTHNNYLLFFYASWCDHCKELFPVYDEASIAAKSLPWDVTFAKINGPKNQAINDEYEVDEYPTVYWISKKDNDRVEYDGSRTVKGFTKFINSQLNFTTEELPNLEALSSKRKGGKYLVFVGDIHKHTHAYEKIIKVAKEDEIDYILWTKSNDFFTKFGIAQNSFDAVLFRMRNKTLDKGERMNVDPATLTRDSFEKLIEIYTRKPSTRLNEDNLLAAVESDSPTPTVITVYGNKNDTYVNDLSNTITKLAGKHRTEYWFLNTTFDSKYAYILTEVFKIQKEQLPTILLINDCHHNADDVDKYVFPANTPLTEDNIEKFLADFKAKKLQKYIYSEEKPQTTTDENGIVKVVGHTYDEVVLKNAGKDVVLLLCVSTSKRCKNFRTRYIRVAQKFKNNKDLVFAEIDTSFNEFSYIKYEKLPSVIIVPGYSTVDDRIKHMQHYTEELYTSKIVEFIQKHAKNAISNVITLDNEEMLFAQEAKKTIKAKPKEKEEDVTNLEEGFNTGLRRTVRTEVDTEHDDDEDEEEEEEENVKEIKEKKTKKKIDL